MTQSFELDRRHANPEWMKDNVGWVIGAIAIALIIGSVYYVSADHPRTASIPDGAKMRVRELFVVDYQHVPYALKVPSL